MSDPFRPVDQANQLFSTNFNKLYDTVLKIDRSMLRPDMLPFTINFPPESDRYRKHRDYLDSILFASLGVPASIMASQPPQVTCTFRTAGPDQAAATPPEDKRLNYVDVEKKYLDEIQRKADYLHFLSNSRKELAEAIMSFGLEGRTNVLLGNRLHTYPVAIGFCADFNRLSSNQPMRMCFPIDSFRPMVSFDLLLDFRSISARIQFRYDIDCKVSITNYVLDRFDEHVLNVKDEHDGLIVEAQRLRMLVDLNNHIQEQVKAFQADIGALTNFGQRVLPHVGAISVV